MRDLQRSCWLLAEKNFKKKLKLEEGGALDVTKESCWQSPTPGESESEI